MEKRNKIKLTERFRQTGATAELVAKFFGDKDSVLIVQDHMLKSVIFQNHLGSIYNENKKQDLQDRIIIPVLDKRNLGYNDFKEKLEKYDIWYLDVCTTKFTLEIIKLALEMNKTLIGHYGGEEWLGK